MSFERLVARFESPVFTYVRRMVGNAHDAEDLTQETFVKAYRSLARFDSKYSFSTWLFTIARRTAANFLRGRKEVVALTDEHDVEGDSDESRGGEGEELWNLARRLLKGREFELLWLRYGEGFSVKEAAKIVGTLEVHARVLLHRARQRLADRIKDRAQLEEVIEMEKGRL